MIRRILVIASLLTLVILPTFAQEKSTQIAFIIDASGSMNAEMEGGTRLTVAKAALTALSAELPANAQASVWAYGHRLPQSDPAASCEDIEELIPLGSDVDLAGAVSQINAIGYTPITRSLELAAESLPVGGRNIIVLLSDGEETCGGDPCAAALALAQSGVDVQVNTIGLVVDDITRSQLQCIADVTGGTYFDAQDSGLLLEGLKAAAAVESGTIILVNEEGERLENLTFNGNNTVTGELIFGQGSANVPEGDYTLMIDTFPQQEATASVIINEITEVVITSNGVLRVVDADGNTVPEMGINVYNPETGEYVGYGVGTYSLAPAQYRVELETTPPTESLVVLRAGETIDLPLSSLARVILENPDGSVNEEIYLQVLNGETDEFLGSYPGQTELVAGGYRLVVETIPARSQRVTLRPGQTLRIPIVPNGEVMVEDSEGNYLEDKYMSFYDPESGEYITGEFGRLALLPGTYNITLDTVPPIDRVVSVKSGETFVITIPVAGGIRLVDSAGNFLEDLYFSASSLDAETGEQSYVNAGFGEFELQPGTYTLSFDLVGYLANLESLIVELEEGQILDFVLPLGFLELENMPENYSITLFYTDPPMIGSDEQGFDVYGFAYTPSFPLIAGDYLIEVDDYDDEGPIFTQKFSVEAGQTLTITFRE